MYFTYSWLKANMLYASEYRYDDHSTVYHDCPHRGYDNIPLNATVGDSPCRTDLDCYADQVCGGDGFCQNQEGANIAQNENTGNSNGSDSSPTQTCDNSDFC